jgi:hypothetical protein
MLRADTGHVWCRGQILEMVVGHVRPPARTCLCLWHPNGQIPSRRYKRPPAPPQLGWPLSSLENTLNQPFLSSKPLSLNLHSNLSFLREIWAILLSDPLNLQASTSLMISVCSFLLGACPLDGLGLSGSYQGCGEPQKVCIALSSVGIW